MRNKLSYTTQETTNNLYTRGTEWMLENLQEYVGSYHRYTDGLVMTEATYNPYKSKKLIPYISSANDLKKKVYNILKPTIKTNYITPKPYRVQIDVTTLKLDYIYRYFLRRYDGLFIEISQSQYELLTQRKIDPNLYKGHRMEWAVVGDINDAISKGAVVRGIVSANKKSVQLAEKVLPGISDIVTDFTEFAVDIKYDVPPDINN